MAQARRTRAARREPPSGRVSDFAAITRWAGATVVPVVSIPSPSGGVFRVPVRVLQITGDSALVELLDVEDVPTELVGNQYWVYVDPAVPDAFEGC